MTNNSLGSFGTPRGATEQTFEYFDVSIRVHPDLSDLAIVPLLDTLGSASDGESSVASLRDMVTLVVHPDDVKTFWGLAHANRQTVQDVAEVSAQLIGALASRPTVQPSDSSGSPPTTATSSTGGSSSPDIAAQAIEHLNAKGRPDLALAVLRSSEAQAAG